MKRIPKLMGFDYEFFFKKGVKNVVVDALSRVQQDASLFQIQVTSLSNDLYARIQLAWMNDDELQAKIKQLEANYSCVKHYLWAASQLLRKGKLVIGGHSGMQATIKKMCEVVYWKKMRKQIKQFIREGDACQRNKPEYNTSYHTTIKTTPFQAVYGQPPPTHISYNKGESMVEAVDESLVAKETSIQMLRFHMKRAQDKMKSLAGKSRSEREFDLETWIIQRVGKVAYKLQLPASAQIHHVFHVSQLKKYKGPTPMFPGQLPTLSTKGLMIEEPFAVLDMRMAKGGNVAAVYVLIQWANGTPADATWELYEDICGKLKGRRVNNFPVSKFTF
ncbi:retrotransposable element Tf2 [Tanacetum coccineum]